MRLVLIAIGVLVALALIITVAGLVLPRDHVATSEITVNQPLDSVYARMRDIGGMTTWWTDLTVSRRVTDAPGERWVQESGGFKMQLDVVSESAPRSFTTKIVEEKGAAFGGEWTYAFAPSGPGTTVSITEKGWVGPPPFRVMMKVMGSHRTMDGMLTALARHYGEMATPLHK